MQWVGLTECVCSLCSSHAHWYVHKCHLHINNHIDYMYTIVYEHVEHVDRFFGAEKELERQHEEMLELQRGLPLMRSRLEAVGMFATQSCLSWHHTCTLRTINMNTHLSSSILWILLPLFLIAPVLFPCCRNRSLTLYNVIFAYRTYCFHVHTIDINYWPFLCFLYALPSWLNLM